MDLPTVTLWCGEPIEDMPREKLVEIINRLGRENQRLFRENCDRSVKHIADLAAMRLAFRQ